MNRTGVPGSVPGRNYGKRCRRTGRSGLRRMCIRISATCFIMPGAGKAEAVHIAVQSWGNVKTAIAYQYGLCAEDLKEEDFAYQDEQFPVIVTVSVTK